MRPAPTRCGAATCREAHRVPRAATRRYDGGLAKPTPAAEPARAAAGTAGPAWGAGVRPVRPSGRTPTRGTVAATKPGTATGTATMPPVAVIRAGAAGTRAETATTPALAGSGLRAPCMTRINRSDRVAPVARCAEYTAIAGGAGGTAGPATGAAGALRRRCENGRRSTRMKEHSMHTAAGCSVWPAASATADGRGATV